MSAPSSTTPAEQLRARVVTLVVAGILVLTAGLYSLVGYLLVTKDAGAVPDALWLAAGALAGSLTTLLANSKGDPASTATGDVAAPAQLEADLDPVGGRSGSAPPY